MKIYLVGGAVRDELLGHLVNERDWVVVGATVQQLLDLGYKPVGKDFPVFLHPQTHEEYALARTERKIGPGYKGFNFYAAPDVTLEDDLKRRDLTINAIAKTTSGELIDPYHGQVDLKNHILRHVSPAFSEDPVRILRVARFAARFGDFNIHPSTMVLMQEMVARGEVNALVAERVWQELAKALAEAYPARFFAVLEESGALPILFPEWSGNTADLQSLTLAATQKLSSVVRYAVLFHNFALNALKAINQRYRVPRDYSELAQLVVNQIAQYQRIATLSAAEILQLLEALDAFRRPARLELFLQACEVISQQKSVSSLLRRAFAQAKKVNAQDLVGEKISGEEIKKILRKRQVNAIKEGTE